MTCTNNNNVVTCQKYSKLALLSTWLQDGDDIRWLQDGRNNVTLFRHKVEQQFFFVMIKV